MISAGLRAFSVVSSFVAALALLGAPAAHAQVDNSAIECGPGDTFFPRGERWPAIPVDVGGGQIVTNPIIYQQQQDGAVGMQNDAAQWSVWRAFGTWSSVQCGGEFVNINMLDAFRWVSGSGGVETADYPTRDRGDTFDTMGNPTGLRNIVYFVTAGWEASTGATVDTVALTTRLFIEDNGVTVTADMEFNDENYDFRGQDFDGNQTGCTSGAQGCFDVETVALHEAGHFIGLNHVNCADAVMFPQASGTQEVFQLSNHEVAAVCALYPPRDAGLTDVQRDFGEACASDAECQNGTTCIEPSGFEGSGLGVCSNNCTVDTDCAAGFRCATLPITNEQFCRAGLQSGQGGATVGTDPTTGIATDTCAPCTSGTQCSSGVCVGDGSGTRICTSSCLPGALPGGGTAGACADGFSCLESQENVFVCWPDDLANCGGNSGVGLNELCFQQTGPSSAAFEPCGQDLLCFGFKPRCEGQVGACVNFCNATDQPCPANLTCCYGVTEDGACITNPTPEFQVGGCFDIRPEGASCVVAEQSVCGTGLECVNFGDATLSKCYKQCSTSNLCAEDSSCFSFQDGCSNEFALCCLDSNTDLCTPSDEATGLDLGVECNVNADCASGLCQKFDRTAACSRECNVVTGVGCPGDVDVNGDGIADGGFSCRLINDRGLCWPNRGPASALGKLQPSGGGCTAVPVGPWVLLALLGVVRRMRRSF